MPETILKGITWNHSRGYTPLVAASQRFSELNPGVEIVWEKRSLQHFADYPIEKLTEHYDLLIIDHPWVGCAAATHCVLPLNEYLPKEYLQDQLKYTVGKSHTSYNYGGAQWALAIDAATPVASYRPDLMFKHNIAMPHTWQDVLDLAKKGLVAVPGIPVDILMNFYMFCLAHGKQPFENDYEVIDAGTGVPALQTMYELWSLVDRKMFGLNPIGVAELMSQGNEYVYCPFAYGYTNYSRNGYANYKLLYTDLVRFNNRQLRSTIGGTGLAVSAGSKHVAEAVAFAEMLASGAFQSTTYIQNGGQPGHYLAWINNEANELCGNYFRNVLPAMERGYMRPRYNGYLHFQDHAGDPIRNYLMHGGDPALVIKEINYMYTASLVHEKKAVAV